MSLPEKPTNRTETYMAKIAGQAVNIPEYPTNRLEAYLEYIAENPGASSQVQSDWNETNPINPDYIKNKPETTDEVTKNSKALVESGAVYDIVSDNTETIEGNPINFSTLTSQNAESTIIDLEPIQDLHGYDKPWVGGAGKNILPMSVDWLKSINTGGTWTDNTYEYNGVTWSLGLDNDGNVISIGANGTASARSPFRLAERVSHIIHFPTGNYILSMDSKTSVNKIYVGKTSSGSWLELASTTGSDKSFSVDVSDNLGIHIDIVQGKQVNNEVFKPMIRVSTEVNNTFEPYTNICPITGRSEIGILGCGVELIDLTNTNLGQATRCSAEVVNNQLKATVTDSSGVPWVGTIISGTQKIAFPISVQKGDILSLATSINCSCTVYEFDSNNTYIADYYAYQNAKSGNYSIVNTNCTKIGLRFTFATASVGTIYQTTVQAKKINTDLTISLGQTVYGGTLDVKNGVLVVDSAIVDMGDLSWNKVSSSTHRFCASVNSLGYKFVSDIKSKSSAYEFKGTMTSSARLEGLNGSYAIFYSNESTTRSFYLYDEQYSDATTLISGVTGQKIWYELATPIVVNLTPHTINLLKGVNNISTDGDKITLTYRDGSVATLGDLTSAVDNLDSKIDESKILTDTTTGTKYRLVVTDGVLGIEEVTEPNLSVSPLSLERPSLEPMVESAEPTEEPAEETEEPVEETEEVSEE